MLPPGAIFKFKIHKNAFAALGELTALPQTSKLVFTGLLCGRGGEGRKGRERFPTSFLQFNPW